MEIKDIRFSHASAVENADGNCGICSVNLDDKIVVHGVKVRRINGSLKVVLPERKVSESGLFKPVVTFIGSSNGSKRFKSKLTEAVLNQYYAEIGLSS